MSEIADRIHALRNPEPEPEAVEAPSEPVSEAPEPVVSEAPSETPEPAAQDDDGETIEVETLDDLAEHFGIDKADLYNLRVPVTQGDRTEMISLSEWKDSYEQSHAARVAAEKAEQRRAEYEERTRDLEQRWKQRLSDVAATLQIAEKQLHRDLEATNWEQLRQEDPAEWAARRQLLQERSAEIKTAQQQLLEAWNSQQSEQNEQAAQQRAQVLERERQALLRAIPQWSDEDAAKSERAMLANYLGSNGFSEEEVNQVSDHRLVVMARKAMLYDREVGKADAAKKRVVKIGKRTTSPGTTRSKATAREDRDAGLKRSLKKSGSVEDAAALIRARMRG